MVATATKKPGDVRKAARAITTGTTTRRARKGKGIEVTATGDATPNENHQTPVGDPPNKPKRGGTGKFDVNQKTIADDVDERVPELDEICQRVLALKAKYKSIGDEIGEDLEEVGKLIKEHNMDYYIISGKKFVPVAGEPTIKIYKVKQQ